MSYLLRYAEQDSSEDKWRIRQTGVYHRYSMDSSVESDLWIFLHPKKSSKFVESLRGLENPQGSSEQWSQGRQALDFLLLSSYFGNWRWYLRDLSTKYEAIVSRGTDQRPRSVDDLNVLSDRRIRTGGYRIDSRSI